MLNYKKRKERSDLRSRSSMHGSETAPVLVQQEQEKAIVLDGQTLLKAVQQAIHGNHEASLSLSDTKHEEFP